MGKYLFYNTVDHIIARHVIDKGSPAHGRFLNMIMILFQEYFGFVDFCLKRYNFLLNKYMKLSNIFDSGVFKIHKNSFWEKITKDFQANLPIIVIDGGQKGSTRKKLYMLGFYYGYSHTISD